MPERVNGPVKTGNIGKKLYGEILGFLGVPLWL